ncbi:MAG: serine/threonine-protein kinase [Polyangiaceae bacterium]
MPVAPSITLPRAFGRYLIFDFIGKGGMAEIYLARQKTELGAARRCVVKQILPELANHSSFGDMLVHEAKLAARLSHANVVQVFDLGRADNRLFIAMEYVEGFDLNDLLRRCARANVPLPVELAVHVVREALKGLDYAHRRTDDEGKPLGIVHRDVSPSNLLVSFEGEVKVCDFGIARANDAISNGSAPHELDEALKGKAGYMSPEHARGESVDARSDVFAAGIVLWELAAGRRMYKTGEGRASLLEQARRGEPPALPENGLPSEDKLRALLATALAPDRAARYASAAAMQRALDDYAASAGLIPSPLKLGEWLEKSLGEDILAQRRARERAAAARGRGAPVVLEAVAASLLATATTRTAETPLAPVVQATTSPPEPDPLPPEPPRSPPSTQTRGLPAIAVMAAVALVALAAVVALAMR